MPRTVCTISGLAGSRSILRRRRLTCTSTARSLAAYPVAGKREARHRFARLVGKNAQHLALAIGQANDLVAAAQLAAHDMEDEFAEAHRFDRRRGGRPGALEDVADAQREFARLERLGHVIVGADLQPLDADLGFGARGQHQDRDARRRADRLGEVEAALARHHHVEDQEIELQAVQLGARFDRGFGGGDAVALAVKIARQQIANAPVVVDDEQMRSVVGRACGGGAVEPACQPSGLAASAAGRRARSSCSTSSRPPASIIAIRKRRAISCAPGREIGERAGDALGLQAGELHGQRFALRRGIKKALAAVVFAFLLQHITLIHQLLENAAERLLGDVAGCRAGPRPSCRDGG